MIFVLGLLAAAAAGPAFAQSYYDVEVIVFELLNTNAVPDVPASAVTMEAPSVGTAPVAATAPGGANAPAAGVVPAAGTAGAGAATTTAEGPGGRFEPLAANKMQLQPEYQSLRTSKSYRPLLHAGWRQQVLGPRMSVSRTMLEQTDAGLLNGELKVYTETFLHIDLDLTLDVPGEGTYRLRDSRRVRSKETHYFDSPRFGVLIRLTPS